MKLLRAHPKQYERLFVLRVFELAMGYQGLYFRALTGRLLPSSRSHLLVPMRSSVGEAVYFRRDK